MTRASLHARAGKLAGLALTAGLLLFACCLMSCSSGGDGSPEKTLRIAAGSESKEIEGIIHEFARSQGWTVDMVYKGSVDMMLDLREEDFPYDAVLPANSMWIRLGDAERRRVRDEASIMRSPVALGVKKALARELGWIDAEVRVADILKAVREDKLHFAMTSATQSNSGASAYMGLLYALAGQPDILDSKQLNDPGLGERIRELLSGVDRSSGSSGWLKEMFLEKYDGLDAMFNYEAMIINANQELVKQGREPLYCVYPVDGLAIADSTLGFVNKPDNEGKKQFFVKLRDHLLSKPTQEEIFKHGFRTALIGMNPDKVDRRVYNPDWGIDLERTISPIAWPRAEVISEALSLYQTSFRKPSFTVYLLDVSGSMAGEGLARLQDAMTGLLDQSRAGRFLLQASDRDMIMVIPFNNRPLRGWAVEGADPEGLEALMRNIRELQARGGTNIYSPVAFAIEQMSERPEMMRTHLPSIILMTDGKSHDGSLDMLKEYWRDKSAGFEFPPVFSVTFGQADEAQLEALAQYAVGRVFDGRKDGLAKAFRKAKGYN